MIKLFYLYIVDVESLNNNPNSVTEFMCLYSLSGKISLFYNMK